MLLLPAGPPLALFVCLLVHPFAHAPINCFFPSQPQGDGRHVEIMVVSKEFEGKSAVNRQRMVYKVRRGGCCRAGRASWGMSNALCRLHPAA